MNEREVELTVKLDACHDYCAAQREQLKEQTEQSEDLLRRNEQLKEQLKRQTELESSMMQITVNHLKQRIADLVEAGWTLNELAEGRRLGQPVSKALHGRVQAARKLLNPGA